MELAAYKKGRKTASREHYQQAPGIEPGKNCTYRYRSLEKRKLIFSYTYMVFLTVFRIRILTQKIRIRIGQKVKKNLLIMYIFNF